MSVEILKSQLLEIRDIGKQIADLYARSKELRTSVATLAVELELGRLNPEEPLEFLMEHTLVQISESKLSKDFNVTFVDYPKL